MKPRKQLIAALVGAVLAVGSAQALAQPPQGGYGPGYGPGMMYGNGGGYGGGWGRGYYGMGPGMMWGYGPGNYGMGPGMMWGYGPGYYGMGPGMMWGYGPGYYGMGPGMMWGYGPGYGAGYRWQGLNLSDEQQSKIAKIEQDLQGKQFALIEKVQQLYARGFDPADAAAAQKTYKEIAGLRQQMFDNALAAHKQIDGVLTKAQRSQLRGGPN